MNKVCPAFELESNLIFNSKIKNNHSKITNPHVPRAALKRSQTGLIADFLPVPQRFFTSTSNGWVARVSA